MFLLTFHTEWKDVTRSHILLQLLQDVLATICVVLFLILLGFSKQVFIVTFVQDTYCEALVNCPLVKQADVCVCIAVCLTLLSFQLRSGGSQILEGCIAEISNISSLDISDNGEMAASVHIVTHIYWSVSDMQLKK